MKLWVGVTDDDWFQYLSERRPDEVNFWQPSGSRQFRTLEAGEPFLFKLHSPKNSIVGGGFFVRYSALPCSLAWETFGEKNGVQDIGQFIERIKRYRRSYDERFQFLLIGLQTSCRARRMTVPESLGCRYGRQSRQT
jgi:putative restriction endonuclease